MHSLLVLVCLVIVNRLQVSVIRVLRKPQAITFFGGYMFRRVLIAVCLAVLFALPAAAEPYVSVNFGLVNLQDSDFNDGFDTGEFTFDTGFGFLGAIGGQFAGDFRGELELGYRTNDIDRIHVDGLGSAPINGDVTSVSLMVNLIKDIPLGAGFTPFFGGGVGMANVEADISGLGSEDDNVFAYQLFVGGGIGLAPNVLLDLQYRYFATSDPDFEGVEAEYMSHNFLVGLRFGF